MDPTVASVELVPEVEVTETAPRPPSAPSSGVVSAPPAPEADPPATVASATAPPTAVIVQRSPFDTPFSGGMAPQLPAAKRPTSGPASRFEWRTPPLWGFRDSAPYLHDGRAKTLDQAVAMHGGESTRSTQNFFKLSAKERQQLETFLKSLTAPAPQELVASNSK